MDLRYQTIIEKAQELLYLTLYGSTLYGTAVEGRSDIDVRGIYLPSPESLALGEWSRTLHCSTGGEGRNGSGDLDLDIWSVQHWLLRLLPAGDTGAIDVLFSPSFSACTLVRDHRLDPAQSGAAPGIKRSRNILAAVPAP